MTNTQFKYIHIFTQLRESPGMCFCVYEVRTNTAEHGPLLPVVENFSSVSVRQSLTIDYGLVENELYSVNIVTTNTDGMKITVGTVEFSKSLSKKYEFMAQQLTKFTIQFVHFQVHMMFGQLIFLLYLVD